MRTNTLWGEEEYVAAVEQALDQHHEISVLLPEFEREWSHNRGRIPDWLSRARMPQNAAKVIEMKGMAYVYSHSR